ncbi:hypothetical protein QYF36_004278 [Acer negundo]|nr:hypothetical protein QYF36_004278 [Acer negundo]
MSIPLLDCMIPTNLRSLAVGGVNICKAFFEWGLHRLTSLKHLTIYDGCPDMISFPMLPTSLTTLRINDCRDLERISPDFQDLSSLKELGNHSNFPFLFLNLIIMRKCIAVSDNFRGAIITVEISSDMLGLAGSNTQRRHNSGSTACGFQARPGNEGFISPELLVRGCFGNKRAKQIALNNNGVAVALESFVQSLSQVVNLVKVVVKKVRMGDW